MNRHQPKPRGFPTRSFLLPIAMAALATLTEGASPAAAVRTNEIRLLFVTGQDYPGHPWRETTPVLRKWLEVDKRFVVRVLEDPHFLAARALTNYDVVLLHFMNWEQPSPGERARRNLQTFVREGGGLVLVHFACGAWQDWPEFEPLAGRVWNPKLRGHDPRGKFTVEITEVKHPITEGLKNFEADDELYTCLEGDRPIEIIAKAKSKVDQKDYPMAFVFNYEKGRVFHCVLGHDLKAITIPEVAELYRRGTAWSAGLAPLRK